MLGALAGGLVFLILLAIAAAIFLFVFWIRMIIDCVKRNFRGENEKVVWILVIALLGVLGAAVYYFAVKVGDKKIVKEKKKK